MLHAVGCLTKMTMNTCLCMAIPWWLQVQATAECKESRASRQSHQIRWCRRSLSIHLDRVEGSNIRCCGGSVLRCPSKCRSRLTSSYPCSQSQLLSRLFICLVWSRKPLSHTLELSKHEVGRNQDQDACSDGYFVDLVLCQVVLDFVHRRRPSMMIHAMCSAVATIQ